MQSVEIFSKEIIHCCLNMSTQAYVLGVICYELKFLTIFYSLGFKIFEILSLCLTEL